MKQNITKMKELNDKQKLFAAEYLKDLNATQAAKRAGYSEKTAYSQGQRLLKNGEIQRIIRAGAKERAERLAIDSDYVLQEAVRIYERCMQAKACTDSKGDQIRDDQGRPLFTFNVNGALRALEIIGKHVAVNAFKGSSDGADELGDQEITIKVVSAAVGGERLPQSRQAWSRNG